MKKIFKNIHVWLAIPVGIVFVIISFTGGMLLFEDEITAVAQADMRTVERNGKKALPADKVMAIAQAHLATLETANTAKEKQKAEGKQAKDDEEPIMLKSLTIAADPTQAYKVNLNKKRQALYVNQYTGEVKGKATRLETMTTIQSLHRNLLQKRPKDDSFFLGKAVIGWSVLIVLLIFITGFLIWLPSKASMLKNRLSINVTKGWRRFWYDLHVAGGFYALTFLLIIAITGLCYAFPWWRSGLYSLVGAKYEKEHKEKAQAGEKGDKPRTLDAHAWQKVADQLAKTNPNYKTIEVSEGEAKVSFDRWGNQRASDNYAFDNQTGKITKAERYENQKAEKQLGGLIYSLHVCSWGGWFSKILGLLVTLIGVILPITGYYLWAKRTLRKSKK